MKTRKSCRRLAGAGLPAVHYLRRILLPSLVLAASPNFACSVPVFRYALEHWGADRYEAVVFHRGPLSAADDAGLRRLKEPGRGEGGGANLAVHDIDLSQSPPAEMLDAWKLAGAPEKPWIVVQPPHAPPLSAPVFSAALDEAVVGALLDSPARREIIRRIGQGESAVWLLLESGDKAKDDATAKMLESRLDYLAGVMELPKLDDQDIKNGLVSVPDNGLRLAFSTLRVARDDPAERALVSMLLASETDLAERPEPMVFPVFGQARVLYALVGAGIAHQNIDRAAAFLVGSCSCEVKEQNPGADLLMAVDWKKVLKAQSMGLQDLPTVADIVKHSAEPVTISPRVAPDRGSSADCCVVQSWVKRHPILSAVALLAVLAAAGWGIARKLLARGKA